MDNVARAYQEAISSLINLHSECENRLPPETLDGVKRILNGVKRRLRKIEPMLKDSFKKPAIPQIKPLRIVK
jgi:hypothetical protein